MKQDTPEEEVLGKLKFLIAAGNDAQAIRMIEDYGLWKQSFMHDKKIVRDSYLSGHSLCRCVTDNTIEAKDLFEVWYSLIKEDNMDYDNWKLATPPHYEYDDEEKEEEEIVYKTLYDAWNSNDVEAFDNMYYEIAEELKIVHEALKATDHGLRFKVEHLMRKMR